MNLYRLLFFINCSYAFVAFPNTLIKKHTLCPYSIDDLIDDLERIAGNIAVGAESVLDELVGIDKQKQLEGKLIPIPIPTENLPKND